MSEDQTQEIFEYLNDLRESGVTNMYGAPAYVGKTFGLSHKDAVTICVQWRETFAERHGLVE